MQMHMEHVEGVSFDILFPSPLPPLHLPQGQVTRAQEAEENYIIKRELAVVKQQCSSATENLQKAQSTIRQLQDQQVRKQARVALLEWEHDTGSPVALKMQAWGLALLTGTPGLDGQSSCKP